MAFASSNLHSPPGGGPDAVAGLNVAQLPPAIKRIKDRTGMPPQAVTADRDYGEASVDNDLHELGITRVALPRKAKPSTARREHEHQRPFRRLVTWRTGSEGRISTLNRGYGWDRSPIAGIDGARIRCGHGVFAQNLVKIGALAA